MTKKISQTFVKKKRSGDTESTTVDPPVSSRLRTTTVSSSASLSPPHTTTSTVNTLHHDGKLRHRPSLRDKMRVKVSRALHYNDIADEASGLRRTPSVLSFRTMYAVDAQEWVAAIDQVLARLSSSNSATF
jgi:hypothetical protein